MSKIDEWGGAWVEKWFNEGEEVTNSHSLSLGSHEMVDPEETFEWLYSVIAAYSFSPV